MKPPRTSASPPVDQALQALQADLGEPILYRASGRFLGGQGLEALPVDLWGLVVLTPSRLVFRRFAQANPLSGARSEAVSWEVDRQRFVACELRRQGFWDRLTSGLPDHAVLSGPSVWLALETADRRDRFPAAWNVPSP